ncbi:MAG: PIN domain-containing protein [Nitrospirae bacterium]|nr:PIN domain-containing protein [Nitrospirota bacterium]
MTLADELGQVNTIFIDTAPVIYYIEANLQYGQLAKDIFDFLQSEKIQAFSSVLTLTEVLSKPIETGNEKLSRKFADFLKHGKNLTLIEISTNIAENAGVLRGKYSYLRTIDAIQLAAAIQNGIDAFLTNDKKLKSIKEINVLVLKDYL